MKKIVALILTLVVVFAVSAVAFADEPAATKGNGVKAGQAADRLQEARSVAQQFKPQLDRIKENRQTIKSQEQEIRKLTQEIRNKIREMAKNGNSPDDETIAKLEDMLNQLNSHKQELAGTLGKIRTEQLKMIQNRREKNWDAVEENLNNIIEIQNTRIESQKQIIEDLNAALELL